MKNECNEEELSRTEREPLNALEAMVHLRCPECKKGIVFRRGMEMNRLCPYCGIKFDREPGYFSGSIWISTLIAMPIMLFIMFGLVYFFRDLHPALAGILAAIGFIPLVPLTIRISRSMWMYVDHQMNPQKGKRRPPDNPDEELPDPVPIGSGYGNVADASAELEMKPYTHRVEEGREDVLHPTR